MLRLIVFVFSEFHTDGADIEFFRVLSGSDGLEIECFFGEELLRQSEGMILFFKRKMFMFVGIGDDFASVHDTIACFRNLTHFFMINSFKCFYLEYCYCFCE